MKEYLEKLIKTHSIIHIAIEGFEFTYHVNECEFEFLDCGVSINDSYQVRLILFSRIHDVYAFNTDKVPPKASNSWSEDDIEHAVNHGWNHIYVVQQ